MEEKATLYVYRVTAGSGHERRGFKLLGELFKMSH